MITGSIARSATRRNLVYSEADFEVFRPVGARRCTYSDEIWHGGGHLISPQSLQRFGYWAPKLKFLMRFDQNVEYKRPAGAYLLRDFHIICRVRTPFQCALDVKISLDLLKQLWSYGGFNLAGSGYSQIFSAP